MVWTHGIDSWSGLKNFLGIKILLLQELIELLLQLLLVVLMNGLKFGSLFNLSVTRKIWGISTLELLDKVGKWTSRAKIFEFGDHFNVLLQELVINLFLLILHFLI